MGFFDKVKKTLESSKNFKYLDDLIHSGVNEIVLDSNIVLSRSEESEYLEGIRLDVSDIVIDGNGYVIDADEKVRIFKCTGRNITIKNVILKNGCAEENGGAIYINGGEINLKDSTLKHNMAKLFGGAINNEKNGKITIETSELVENMSIYDGGAISNENGKLTIKNSILAGNKARRGGSIFNQGDCNIVESGLNGNVAKNGGSLYNAGGELTIIESKLNKNTVKELTKVNLLGEIFNLVESNIVKLAYNEHITYSGGAIYNSKGNLKIFHCEISNNKSPNNIIFNNDYIEIHDTDFKYNQSKQVLLNNEEVCNLGIFNGEFRENNVEETVIYNNGKFCIIEKTIFQNNNSINIINENELTLVTPKIKDNGKTILNKKYILIKKSFSELKNTIFGEGAVEIDENLIHQEQNFDFGYLDKKVHQSSLKKVILDQNIHFENYERDYYEGGIELDIDDLVIDGNGKTIDGANKTRIFIITGKNIVLKNIIFKNGHSHKSYDNPFNNHGGAIKVNHNVNLTIKNCEFINNISEEDGGTIYNQDGKLSIIKSTLMHNIADSCGGALYNSEGSLIITESTFEYNESSSGGGAVSNGGHLEINGCKLNENTSKKDGGAVSNGGQLEINGCKFNKNMAVFRGGALYNSNGLSITESIFAYNKSGMSGGAVSNGGQLEINGCKFNENRAVYGGGALYNSNCLTIRKSTLNGNLTETVEQFDGGGAIRNYKGTLIISESSLNHNISNQDGGAIYNQEGSLTLTNATLNDNIVRCSGGAIYLQNSSKYESNNCTFKDNKPDDVYEGKG